MIDTGRPLYQSEESRLIHESTADRLDALERAVRDHDQRLQTAQTHQWKRLWFWLQGWPLTDWNAPRRNWRPWHRVR